MIDLILFILIFTVAVLVSLSFRDGVGVCTGLGTNQRHKLGAKMGLGRPEYKVADLEAKLYREYARYETTEQIFLLESNDNYFAIIEKLMMAMSNHMEEKPDQVYMKLVPDSEQFDYLRQFDTIFSKDEMDRLINKIISLMDAFLAKKDFPKVDYGITDDGMFYCGKVTRKYAPELTGFLYYKVKDIKDKKIQDLLILNMIIRYESIINRHQNWNLPTPFYKVLKNKYGIRGEGFSSPLNARLAFIEYTEIMAGERQGPPECWFCSLFHDTDEPFGSRGNIFNLEPSDVCDLTMIFTRNRTNEYVIDKMIKGLKKGCKYLVRCGGDFEHYEGEYKKEFARDEIYYEDHTKFEKPIRFSYIKDTFYYNFKIDADDFKLLMPDQAYLDNYEAQTNKLKREFHRYNFVQKMLKLQNLHGKLQYEWRSILERFLLSMANLAIARAEKDQVFIDLPQEHELYKKMEAEMGQKHIKGPGATINGIRSLIKEYFSTESKKYVKYYKSPGQFHVTDGNTVISIEMGLPRYTMLISKAVLNSEHIDFNVLIAIMVVRYECVLPGGQHWNIPFTYYEHLYDKFGLKLEGFASPLNSQVLLLDYLKGKGAFNKTSYCSLFHDTDEVFGSRGSIFTLDIGALMGEAAEGPKNDKMVDGHHFTMCLNPPFVESLIEKMCDLVEGWMKKYPGLRVFTGGPSWTDAKFYKRLKSIEGLKYTKDLKYGEFYYEDSYSDKVNRIQVRSGYSTFVIANFDRPDNEPEYSKASSHLNEVKY